jgi:cyclic pyranopterin phosphate synthase
MTHRVPTYLRVVVTTRCNYACPFCHMEGDPNHDPTRHELPLDSLRDCLSVMARQGIKKIKYLGGEPMLRNDLPAIIAHTRQVVPDADLSMITAAAPTAKLGAALDAGLDRVNVSIHGFSPAAMLLNNHNPAAFGRRARFIEALLATGRPIKLNYVYTGPHVHDDLDAMLDWAATLPVLVNVLDDLGQDLGYQHLLDVLTSLRGAPQERSICHDPQSLDTLHLRWTDGLRVELKDHQLGHLAPWSACHGCPVRTTCKEGIFALRLNHQGTLTPCMDRPELGFPLARIIAQHGVEIASDLTARYLNSLRAIDLASAA